MEKSEPRYAFSFYPCKKKVYAKEILKTLSLSRNQGISHFNSGIETIQGKQSLVVMSRSTEVNEVTRGILGNTYLNMSSALRNVK